MKKVLNKAPVLGFVRYSQKIIFGQEKDVFESEYFEYRFEIFKNVTLKSFQQQTDNSFILLLLHSENMPVQYKMRFLELEESNLFLYNIFVEDNQKSFDDALNQSLKYVSFTDDAALTFRIDNDDAVQIDFIKQLRSFVKQDFVGYSISVPTIAIVKRVSNKLYLLEERYYPSNSIGLAYVTGRDDYKTIMKESQHHLVNDTNSMILLAKNAAAGLQTINGENAINSINSENAKIFSDVQFEEYLKENRFENLELSCMRIFPLQNSLDFSPIKIIRLLLPPIFFMIFKKLRNFFYKE